MKIGLKGKMLLVIISLLILTFTIIAVISNIQIAKNISVLSKNELYAKTDYMREKILSFLDTRELLISEEAHAFSHLILDNTTEQTLKNELIEHYKDLSARFGILNYYIGYPNDSFYNGTDWKSTDPNWKASERPWFKKAVEANGKTVYTDIYIDSITNAPVISLSQAIQDKTGNTIAVIGMDIGFSSLSQLFVDEKIGENGYASLLDKDGRFIIHPVFKFNEDLSKADTLYNISGGSLKEIASKLLSNESSIVTGKFSGVKKVYYSQSIEKAGFYLISSLTEEDYTKELNALIILMILIMLGSIIFFSGFIFIFIGRITSALKNVADGMQSMAEGDLTFAIKKVHRKDELGDLSNSVEAMQKSMKDIISSIKEETTNVNAALGISSNNILELSDNINKTSESVELLSAGMEETASSTQQINSTTAEIEHAVETIADKAQDGALSANEISNKADGLKDKSKARESEANQTRINIKNDMDSALEKIKAVDKINSLSEAILQIATQTNLLALNAAIESARAGEAGKGFMVVADEIRKLAEDSKSTVTEIRNTVEDVYAAVQNLVNISKYTLSYIETKVVESYKESVTVGENYNQDAVFVNNLVLDLSATSEELLASIKTVAEAINEISKANYEGAQETTSISHKVINIKDKAGEISNQVSAVKKSADKLSNIVASFKI